MVKPRVSYVICSIQRRGTQLLSEALQNTGLAGNAEEYFLCCENGRWEDSDGWWARTVIDAGLGNVLQRQAATIANGLPLYMPLIQKR